MGLLKRLFGDGQGHPKPTVAAADLPTQRTGDLAPSWMVAGMQVTLYDGEEDLEVVGESPTRTR